MLNTSQCNDKTAEIFRLQADLCRSLADPKRLMIIHILRDNTSSVNELSKALGLKQSNTSQHLGVLRKAGIVTAKRTGNVVRYSLGAPQIALACDLVRQVIAEELRKNQDLRELIQAVEQDRTSNQEKKGAKR